MSDAAASDVAVADREQRRFYLVAAALAIFALWVIPMASSLWLDETGTWWVIKDGLGAAVHRAAEFQGQTPAFYVIEWLFRSAFGRSEIVLRLPEILAMIGAVVLVYRIARRLFDAEVAAISTVVFATNPNVIFAASDARPYAIAMLLMCGSTLVLVRWLDEHARWTPVAYVVLAAAMVYEHYVFAPVLIAHAVFAYARTKRVNLRVAGATAAGIAVLLAPAIPQFLSLFRRRASLSIPGGGFVVSLFSTVTPPLFVFAIMIGVLAAGGVWRARMRSVVGAPGALAFAAACALAGPLSLWAASEAASVTVFADRYLITASVGIALGAAWIVACIASDRARRYVVLSLLACSLLLSFSKDHFTEDWRGAAARVNALVTDPAEPVLVHAAFVEAAQTSWLRDPNRLSYLTAPLSYYPMRGRIVGMPYFYNQSAREYLESLVPTLDRVDKFLVVTRYSFVGFPIWLDGRLSALGFDSTIVGRFDSVVIHEYARRSP